MAENVEYVQKGFRILHPLFAAYLAREMGSEYGESWWERVLTVLSDQERDLPKSGGPGELVDSLDFANCLRLFERQWQPLFRRKLSQDYRTWARELMGIRNKTAHIGGADFSEGDTWRALDTMSRLCGGIDSDGAEEIRSLLRELRYGSDLGSAAGARAAVRPAPGEGAAAVLKVPGGERLPSWRDVIEPHPDVAQGNYRNAEFAADLAQVARAEGAFEYRDPVEFFARTYLTEGMTGLLVQALRRFDGKDGEPVLQLKTAFGGGKTHSLLALYHMSRGGLPLGKVPALRPILSRAGVERLPEVNVAVLVGSALNPAKCRLEPQLPGVRIHTIWGEMAAQLAVSAKRPEVYDLVKEADKKGVAPGSLALKELFDACGTCLVLIDELVSYAKVLYGAEGLAAGTFDNLIAFIQQVTEAASASRSSLVVASIPESDIEVGEGDGGKRALAAITHTFGRKESIWKPVGAHEGFEVVRRRLFLDCRDEAAREEVCAAFSRMYRENAADFPPEAKEAEYRERLLSCYPIHPEFFDRLYEDWASIETFQRTRGVLRLMAAVIHELWMANDAGAMILPGSLTLDIPKVRDELTHYLPETWNGIIDREVDGRNSIPYQIDQSASRYGRKLAARRAARTIMLGSAPTVRAQKVRGIEAARIRLGMVLPGENIADFNDALSALRGALAYLYADPAGNRYWYDTRPTLRKTAMDRAAQISDVEVADEIRRRLKKDRGAKPFSGLHVCPDTPGEVADEQAVRLVLLKTRQVHRQGQARSKAVEAAEEILNGRGNAPRVYRNMLAFVAPDAEGLSGLEKAVREHLAWQSIRADRETLNLDAAQNTETRANVARSGETVELRLKETYVWLLVPYIDREADPGAVLWDIDRIGGGTQSVAEKAAERMLQNEQMITAWGPALLKMELDNLLWKEDEHIQVRTLWEYITTYCYLPRLADIKVLAQTIRSGIASGEFAFAASFDGRRYEGLTCGAAAPAVSLDGCLVKLPAAQRQLRGEAQKAMECAAASLGDRPVSSGENGLQASPGENGGSGFFGENGLQAFSSENRASELFGGNGLASPSEAEKTAFYLRRKLDNARVVREVQRWMDEVVSLLTSVEEAGVELTLEVRARAPKGFPADIERAVTENCRTLGAEEAGFGAKDDGSAGGQKNGDEQGKGGRAS